MTDEDTKIVETFRKCAEVRLPDDFTDRLVERIRKDKMVDGKSPVKTMVTRIVLVAASLTLLLGFVPNVLERPSRPHPEVVAHLDEIRPVNPGETQDDHLNTLAFLGFCREVIRRRVKPLVERFRKRREEE